MSYTIQNLIRADFDNGGFVLHQIPFNGGKLSAWFDVSGNLLDIERFNVAGKAAKVTEDAKRQARLFGMYQTKTMRGAS